MRRAVAGLAAVAAISLVSATATPGSTVNPATKTRAATGFSDPAETVMGTLVGPPSRRFLTRIRNGKMGGVLLLGNGWLTRRTAAAVTAELQQAACTRGEPLLIAVDQEGGIVRRLAWAPPTEAPDEMSSASDRTLTGRRSSDGAPLGGGRRRLRARRRHPGIGAELPRLARLLPLPYLERTDGPRLRRRPADERRRGDGEALPRPRPRKRQHRQRAHRHHEPPPGSCTADCSRSRARSTPA